MYKNTDIGKYGTDNPLPQNEGPGENETPAAPNNESRMYRRALDLGLKGLNVLKAIESFGGDEDSYFEVLRSYAVNLPPLLDSIESVSTEDIPNYTIIVHGIKGSSRGVGADEFAVIAERLEIAGKEGDHDFISANNQAFIGAARELESEINRLIVKTAEDNPKQKKDKPDVALLEKILTACRTYDIDSADSAVSELESYEYESGGELVSWLWDNIQRFNISDIEAKLSAML